MWGCSSEALFCRTSLWLSCHSDAAVVALRRMSQLAGPARTTATHAHLQSLRYFFRVNRGGRKGLFLLSALRRPERKDLAKSITGSGSLSLSLSLPFLSLLLKMKAIMSAAVSSRLFLPPEPNVHKRHFSRPFPGHDY